MASNMSLRCRPCLGGIFTPQACSNLARNASFFDVLETGQSVGNRPHVAAALHVVLAAQRIEAAAVAADMAGQQGQIDQGDDVVDGVVMFGDARESSRVWRGPPWHRHARPRGWPPAGTPVSRSARSRVYASTRVAIGREAAGRIVDKPVMGQTGGDDLPSHGVGERDIGSDVEPQPHVGPLRRRGAPRVHHEQAGAAADALQQVMEEDRMRLPRVGAPKQDDVRFFHLPDTSWCPPPAPNTAARPATLGACQVRLQLSMWLQPMTDRTNFCAT